MRALSIWIVFIATGPEENLGRVWLDRRRVPQPEPQVPQHLNTDQRKSKISAKETEKFGFL